MDNKTDKYINFSTADYVQLHIQVCIDYISNCGMSQKSLASFLEVSPTTITRWRKGYTILSAVEYVKLNSVYTFLKGEGGVFKYE